MSARAGVAQASHRPTRTRVNLNWQEKAVCVDVDPDLFSASDPGGVARAKLVCRTCPVISECLNHAMACNEDGIWGGRTFDERKELRRAYGLQLGQRKTSRSPRHGDEAGYQKHLQHAEKPCLSCSQAHTRAASERNDRLSKARPPITEKACRECGVVKPVSEFYRDTTLVDGLKSLCKPCYRDHRSKRWAS